MSLLSFATGAAPGAAQAGYLSVYAKSDDLLYTKNSAGTEKTVASRDWVTGQSYITSAGSCAYATYPAGGGTFVTSSNIGSQSVSYASTAGSSSTVTVNSYTGNVNYNLLFNSGNTIYYNSYITANASSGAIGCGALTVTGAITATGDITAYYSDSRLKIIKSTIPNALDKVLTLSGVIFTNNDTAKSYGYTSDEEQIGVIAQEVEAVLPQIIAPAPFDWKEIGGVMQSTSGENYKTVKYEKLVPLLIEAIKELNANNKELESRLSKLESK